MMMNSPQIFSQNAILIILFTGLTAVSAMAQKPAYKLFSEDGKKVKYEKMLESASKADIVLFGEYHTNPISHWLQLELTNDLYKARGEELILGAEMFEADNQLIIDEYFAGLVPQKRFEEEARLWNNYQTDYKPLLEFAKENGLRMIATNIPRRYASMVSSGGFESLETLSDQAKSYIAPLPVEYDAELPGYKSMLSMMGMPGKGGPDPQNFPKAQAIKDATMGWNIAQNLKEGQHFIHFHGTYHSNNYEEIYWYLGKYKPNAKIITIATVLQSDLEVLDEENMNLADFIIIVPNRMTRTY